MKIGNTINLEVLEPNKEIESYRCKIIEKNDQFIIVDYPIHVKSNKTSYIPVGTNVRVSYTNKKAVYQFRSEIATKVKSKIPALAISIPENSKINRIQRRRFVRVDTSVDVAVHSLNRNFMPFASVTMDISGGGISVIIQNDSIVSIGEQVKVFMVLPMLSGEYFYIIVEAEVVFIKKQNNISSTSLKFININYQDQQKIIRFCFDKQREQRNKELL